MSKHLISSLNEWVVPSHWSVLPLKHMCSASALYGLNESSESYSETGVRFLRTTDITEEGTLNNNPVFLDVDKVSGYLLSNGDLLISRSGTVGRCYIYEDHIGPCAYAGYLVRFVLKVEHNPWFVYYVTKSLPFMKWLSFSSIEATIGNVNGEKFANAPIPVPPQKEQDRIVHFLKSKTNEIDTLIAAKQRLLNLLTEKRRTLITQAVTKGLDSSVQMKDSGIPWLGEIPEHWEIWKIGHFSSVGNGSTPLRDNTSYWYNGSIPWLNSASTNEAEISSSTQFVTEQAVRECHLPLVKKNSVLIAITGQGKTRGQAAVLLFDATINQHVAYVTADKERIIPHFLYLWFVAQYNHIRAMSEDGGGTKGALTCEDISAFRIGLPPLTEQNLIYQFVQHETTKLDLLR
jgi:type I restriction enzyme S subunit